MTVSADSAPALEDVVKAETACLPTAVPDCVVYDGAGWLGSGVHNTTGADQTHSQSVRIGVAAVYTVRVYNHGNAAGRVALGGTAWTALWVPSYTDHATSQDITDHVVDGVWETP